jgi:hypothetical protein
MNSPTLSDGSGGDGGKGKVTSGGQWSAQAEVPVVVGGLTKSGTCQGREVPKNASHAMTSKVQASLMNPCDPSTQQTHPPSILKAQFAKSTIMHDDAVQ